MVGYPIYAGFNGVIVFSQANQVRSHWVYWDNKFIYFFSKALNILMVDLKYAAYIIIPVISFIFLHRIIFLVVYIYSEMSFINLIWYIITWLTVCLAFLTVQNYTCHKIPSLLAAGAFLFFLFCLSEVLCIDSLPIILPWLLLTWIRDSSKTLTESYLTCSKSQISTNAVADHCPVLVDINLTCSFGMNHSR